MVIFVLTEKGEWIAHVLLLLFVIPDHSDCPRIEGFGITKLYASANPLMAFISKFI